MISTGKKTHSISCVVEIKNFLDKILQSMIYKSTFLCAFFKKKFMFSELSILHKFKQTQSLIFICGSNRFNIPMYTYLQQKYTTVCCKITVIDA